MDKFCVTRQQQSNIPCLLNMPIDRKEKVAKKKKKNRKTEEDEIEGKNRNKERKKGRKR